jgi:putative transposase
MGKAYPSNLTQAQYELLSDLIPEAKPGGRPRSVEMWEILNAIFYVLVEGDRWRALPGNFPAWQTVYTYFRNWRKDWDMGANSRSLTGVDSDGNGLWVG